MKHELFCQDEKSKKFEPLLSIVRLVFEKKTGEEWAYCNGEISYESCSNGVGGE